MTYRTDANLRRDILRLVDIDLVVLRTGELGGELLKDWRDELAGTAPGRPEVDDDGLFATNL